LAARKLVVILAMGAVVESATLEGSRVSHVVEAVTLGYNLCMKEDIEHLKQRNVFYRVVIGG